MIYSLQSRRLENLGDLTRTYGAATLTDSELETLSHSNWGNQSNVDGYVIARHYHFNTFWEHNLTSNVHGAEIELWTIVVVEWSVTATLFLLEDVDLSLEVVVRSNAVGLAEHHTTLNLVLVNATEEKTNVVTSLALIEELAEHLDASNDGETISAKAKELYLVTNLNDTGLDTASSNGATTGDREDILDRHKERLVKGARRQLNPVVASVHELHNLILPLGHTIEGAKGRTADEWGVLLEVVLLEQVTHLHLNEVKHLLVVNLVALVDEYHETWNVHLTSKKDVLTGLGHRTIGSSNYDDGAIHLSGTGNHVLHIVSVARAVNVSIVTLGGLILDVSGVDGDTTLLLLRGVINLIERLNLLLAEALLVKYE